MKKLFMLMLVGICSQSFCMDREAGRGVNTPTISRESLYARINQFLAHFPDDDQGEQISHLRQDLIDMVSAYQDTLEFDRNHLGSLGERNYHISSATLNGVMEGDAVGNMSITNEERLDRDRIELSQIMLVMMDNDIAAMLPAERQSIYSRSYCLLYRRLCDMFMMFTENTQDGEVDDTQGRAVHRISELVRQMSDMVIRIGGYVQDQVQQQ